MPHRIEGECKWELRPVVGFDAPRVSKHDEQASREEPLPTPPDRHGEEAAAATSAPYLWGDGQQLSAALGEPSAKEVTLGGPASEEHRWRSQAVTAPIEAMTRAGAQAGAVEERYSERYDLRRLAHRLIDAVVSSMGFAREITDVEVIAGVAAMASRMAPDAGQEEWVAVAEFVYRHLMNAPGDFGKFQFVGIDAEGRRRPFEFQLLVPRESDAGIAVNASPEAINVFLKAFDLDVTDAEVAMSVMLERQISDGRFEAAARTAETAGRISLAAAARIGELLEDTKRDVGAVDWKGSMREDLERARRHVTSRIPEDDRLLQHVQAGTENGERAIAEASGEIAERLLMCKRLHLSLEDRLVKAHRTFLDAQTEQRLVHRRRLRLLSLNEQLFLPTLSLTSSEAGHVTAAFATAALGPTAPRLPSLGGLIEALLAPSKQSEPALRELEEPDVVEEPETQAYSADALAKARSIFRAAAESPRRLSGLLGEARETGDDEVTELVWLGALWSFAPETQEEQRTDLPSHLGELTAGAVGSDDGTALINGEFGGADLLLGSPARLGAVDVLRPTAETDELTPVQLDAYRIRK